MEANCKCGDEPSGFIRRGEFLDQLIILNTPKSGTYTNDQHSVQELQLDAKVCKVTQNLKKKSQYVNQFRITQCPTSTVRSHCLLPRVFPCEQNRKSSRLLCDLIPKLVFITRILACPADNGDIRNNLRFAITVTRCACVCVCVCKTSQLWPASLNTPSLLCIITIQWQSFGDRMK